MGDTKAYHWLWLPSWALPITRFGQNYANWHHTSLTRFAEILPLWRNFERLWAILNPKPNWAKIHAIGQSFIVANGQNWKHYLAIWSHGFPRLFSRQIKFNLMLTINATHRWSLDEVWFGFEWSIKYGHCKKTNKSPYSASFQSSFTSSNFQMKKVFFFQSGFLKLLWLLET